jgi:hypothetical protein
MGNPFICQRIYYSNKSVDIKKTAAEFVHTPVNGETGPKFYSATAGFSMR